MEKLIACCGYNRALCETPLKAITHAPETLENLKNL